MSKLGENYEEFILKKPWERTSAYLEKNLSESERTLIIKEMKKTKNRFYSRKAQQRARDKAHSTQTITE